MDDLTLTAESIGVFLPDTEILARAKRGDLAAFEELLKQNEVLVFRVALRLLGDAEDARDVAQTVFLRFHSSLSGLDERREIGPWLYRVTVNAAADLRRRRRPVVALDYETADGGDSPERQADLAQARRNLEAALLRLGEKERAAIVLRDIEGLSTAEVAEALGSSEPTVRSQISTARAKLRGWLRSMR